MGSYGRTESRRWWREGEYLPKNSKWLLESLHGVYGTVESMVRLIEDEEDADSPASRAEIRDGLVGKVKEICAAYFELVEQHDRLVGAKSSQHTDSTEFSNQEKPSSLSVNQENKTEAEMLVLKENEIENALSEYNGLDERLHNVKCELSKTKADLAKKEEMLFDSERLNYQQKMNLESLRQKVELQERELKQKREEIERIIPRLDELEMYKSNLDTNVSVLEREIKYLNIQKVSYEEKISNLLKDLSLLNENKESHKKEVELHLREKEKIQSDLSSQILDLNIQKVSHEEKISNLLEDLSLLNEKNKSLEKEVALHLREKKKNQSDLSTQVLDLNTQKISCEEKLSNLLKDVSLLNENKEKLEKELELHLREKEKIQSDLSSQILDLNAQKVSHEEKISNLIKDLNLLKENKETLEKEVAFHLREKEKIQSDLSSQILEASKVNAMHEAQLLKCETEIKFLSEKNVVLEKILSKANIEYQVLKEKILALQGNVEILTQTIIVYLKKNSNRKISLSNSKTEAEFLKAKSNDKGQILQNLIVEKETIFTQIQLLEEQIKKLNQTLEHAEGSKLHAERTINSFNIHIERFNVEMPSVGVGAYHFLISMSIWREVDIFLNKMPVWRKMRDRVESGVDGLKEGLGTVKCRSFIQKICWLAEKVFHFFGVMKHHLVKYIRMVLCFCHRFLAARFSSKQGTSEIDSSHSNSKNEPSKINDGTDVQSRETEQEVLSKRKEIFKKLAELRQQELKKTG